MLRAILFDLGDTLIDFEPMDTRRVFQHAARRTYRFLRGQGHALPPFPRYCRPQFGAIRWAYLWAKLRRREFNSLHLLQRFCRNVGVGLDEPQLLDLAWRWYQPITERTRIEPGLPEMLDDFRRLGLKLAVVSNTFIPADGMDRHLAMFGLLDYFPVRVYSSDVGFRKPDRRIYQHALQQLGNVSPAEALFVGDLLKTDILGARRCGMKTVLKQPWGTTRAHRMADAVVRSLSELPAVIDRLYAAGPASSLSLTPIALETQTSHPLLSNGN